MKDSTQKKHVELPDLIDSALAFYETNKTVLLVITLGVVGAAFIFLFLWGTAPHGIGIRTDSVAYLWSAKDLAVGIGLGTMDAFGKFKPLNHFPPLYPVLLAVFEFFKIDGMIAARGLGALFIGLLVLLFGAILHQLTNRSFWFPIIGVLVLLFMQAFWETSAYAMTEPLYLICSLTGLICLHNYSTSSKKQWLLISAIFLSLSFLTRYIGISVIIAGSVFLLFLKKTNLKGKLFDALILGSISCLPMLIWLLRNKLLTGSATNREINFVPITAQEWKSTLAALMTWIEPIRAVIKVNLLYLVILSVALGISFLIFRSKADAPVQTGTDLPRLLAIYAVTYILLTVFSRLWLDPTIPLYEDRILYPFLVPVFFLVVYGLFRFLQFIRKDFRILPVLGTGILVMIAWGFIRSNSSATFPYVRTILHSHEDGLGLQFRTNTAENFQKAIAQLPEDDLFFTDNVEELYFFTKKPSTYIGDLTASDIQMLRAQLSKGEVVVVFMDSTPEKQQALLSQIPQFQLIFTDNSSRSVYIGRTNR